jgi:hypothetical protein
MGNSYSPSSYGYSGRDYGLEYLNRQERKKRMKLADKIVMVMVDRINQVVVRPGPDPEERECYDMAKEIRDLSPELAVLIAKVLKVAEDEE